MSSFIWYELMTANAAGAEAFYGKLVGWTFSGGTPGKTGPEGYRMIQCSDGGMLGGLLPLSPDMQAHGARPFWIGYLNVADIDTASAAIAKDGGKILMPKMTIPEGSFAMVTDPQGIPFYIMKPTPPAGKPEAKSDSFGRHEAQRVAWNELFTPDLAGAKAFYKRHFGFTTDNVMPMGPEFGDYCFIDADGQGIGAMMKQPPHVPHPGWNYYIRVNNIDTAKAVIESEGGKVFNGPHQVPGGEWIINGCDPQGAPLSVVGAR